MVRKDIRELKRSEPTLRKQVTKNIQKYHTCYEYLEEWTEPLEMFKEYCWILLKSEISWSTLVDSCCIEHIHFSKRRR